MQDLANELTPQLDRSVRDETGISQKYDFVLTFSTDGLSGPANLSVIPPTPLVEGGARSLSAGLPDARELPDLLRAVQSQLGLKLDPKRGSVEVIVIDHIEKTPSGN
jgi:uncharacterized protein (TIGR03435 family)